MTIPDRFTQVLQDWSEVFMRRSMHDFIQFSKDSGLSMGQTNVLFHLHHGSSCGVSDIGELLGVTNPAASQMVHRMVTLGLIERTEDPDDRRAKQLQLTANGRLIVKESIEARRRWMEQLTYTLTSEEQTLIINALNILVDAAQDLEPGVNRVESREQNEPGQGHIGITN